MRRDFKPLKMGIRVLGGCEFFKKTFNIFFYVKQWIINKYINGTKSFIQNPSIQMKPQKIYISKSSIGSGDF